MRCTQELPLSNWHRRPILRRVSLCQAWPSKFSWPANVYRCLPCLLKAPNLVPINRKLHKVYYKLNLKKKTWDEYISTRLCRTRITYFLCPPETKITPELQKPISTLILNCHCRLCSQQYSTLDPIPRHRRKKYFL